MTDKLPPNLLQLFQPRPPLRYLPPSDFAPEKRTNCHVDGLAGFISVLKDEPAPYHPTESWLERKDREKLEKREAAVKLVTEDVKDYHPEEDAKIQGNALNTLFVSRLPYTATSDDLKNLFRQHGPIVRIRLVENEYASAEEKKKKKHRGYAFVEFERENDMRSAIKMTEGITLQGRRLIIDVERGRTVKQWKPRRYGGGLGGRGYMKEVSSRSGMNFSMPAGPGGVMRGGFRGGFRGGRGGFDRSGSGGFDRGNGSDRGGFRQGGAGRGGFGGAPSNGAPEGAPSGPRGPRAASGSGYGGGFGQPNGYSGGNDQSRSGYSVPGYGSGGNREPVGDRPSGDRVDRGDRGERTDRGDRSDRNDRGDRGDRSDRGDRYERSDKNDRGDRGERGGYRDRDKEYGRKRPFEGEGGYHESRRQRHY